MATPLPPADARKDALLERMNVEGYHNWLLVGQGLLHMKRGIEAFADRVIKDFHDDLVKIHSPKTCSNVTCNSKNITFNKTGPEFWKFRNSCPTQVCEKWLSDIAKELANVKARDKVYWSNTEVQKWQKERWQVAKVYMENVKAASANSPTESDASSLLTLMSNCKRFLNHGLSKKDLQQINKVKGIRNKVMHSAQMTMKDQDMKDHLTDMKQLLDLVHTKASHAEAQSAKEDLQAIESLRAKIVDEAVMTRLEKLEKELPEVETEIWKEKLAEMEEDMTSIEDKTAQECMEYSEEARASLNFLNANPDLRHKLEDQVAILFSSLEAVTERMDRFDDDLDSLKKHVAEIHEEMKQMKGKMGTPGRSPGESNYKNLLQNYCQQAKIHPLPQYDHRFTEDGKGFFSDVKVDGRTYRSKKSHPKKIQADLDAAHEALQALNLLVPSDRESSHHVQRSEQRSHEDQGETQPDISLCQEQQQLDAMLTKLNQPGSKCVPSSTNSRTLKVIFHAPQVMQVFHGERNQKRGSEEAAKEVMGRLGKEKGTSSSSYKDALHSVCGQMQVDKPLYEWMAMGEKGERLCTVVRAGCIDGTSEVCVEGDVGQSNAFVCSKAHEMLKKLQLDSLEYTNDAAVADQTETNIGIPVTENQIRNVSIEEKVVKMETVHEQSPVKTESSSSSQEAVQPQLCLEQQQLNALLSKLGQPTALFEALVTNSAVKKVTFQVPEVLQVIHGETNQKIGKEQAAKQVLEKVDKEKGSHSSYKDALYSVCGQLKVQTPLYKWMSMGEKKEKLCTVVRAGCIEDVGKVSVEGDIGQSDADVCRTVLGLLKELNFEESEVSGNGNVGEHPDERNLDSPGKDKNGEASDESVVENSAEVHPSPAESIKGGNYKGKLLEICQQKKLPDPEWIKNEQTDKFKFSLKIKWVFETQILKPSKKEVERYLAAFVLSKIRAQNIASIDTAQSKRELNEICKELPDYECIQENSQFRGKVTCQFLLHDSESHPSKKQAEHAIARRALEIISD